VKRGGHRGLGLRLLFRYVYVCVYFVVWISHVLASSKKPAKKLRACIMKSAYFYRPRKFVREKSTVVGRFFSFVWHQLYAVLVYRVRTWHAFPKENRHRKTQMKSSIAGKACKKRI